MHISFDVSSESFVEHQGCLPFVGSNRLGWPLNITVFLKLTCSLKKKTSLLKGRVVKYHLQFLVIVLCLGETGEMPEMSNGYTG